jgi:dephospho-CoA kinase
MIQNKPKIIGLTGGIATGKSTVSKLLQEKGLPVIDADVLARQVVEVGKPAYRDIVTNFGEHILNDDGNIDRQKLGTIIFDSMEHRILLNKIVHPRVMEEIKKRIKELSIISNVIFLDVPLLIEEKDNISSYGIEIDEIWLVYTSYDIQIERLMKREGIDYHNALKRIKSQMSIDKKKKFADIVINNSKDIEHLSKSIDLLISAF